MTIEIVRGLFPMSNAWFLYVGPLGICVAFVTWAILIFRKVIRRDRNAKGELDDVGAGCGSVLIGGVGGVLGLAIVLTSPTPLQREKLFDHVFRTPPERIEKFVILASPENEPRALTRSQVVIDDPVRIGRIAEILRTSREVWPNHPRTQWTTIVRMVTSDGTYQFSVRATVPGDTNGTLVSALESEEGGGWNLGDVRADGLDQLLQDVVSRAHETTKR